MDDLKQRILVVDPDEKFSSELSALLKKNGYLARSCADPETALAEISGWQPDLLIVDILARTFNAPEFLNRAIKNPHPANLKALALAQPRQPHETAGPGPRMAGHLTKPVDLAELAGLLKRLAVEPSGDTLVLLAGAEAELSGRIKVFLEKIKYRTVPAATVREAVEKARSLRPAAVILDLDIPGGGFQVMDELQDERSTSDIPVIALSGAAGPQSAGAGASLPGEIEIISKQAAKEVLLKAIEKILRPEAEPRQNASPPAGALKPKVVLADDQTELLTLMKEMLEKAGFEVFAASDGKEALEQIQRENPDIAVLDYNMPEKDGLELTQELKADPLFAHLPVIILTAVAEKQAKMNGLNLGVDDYLIKPVDTDELTARIRMILKRTKQVLDSNPLSRLPGNPSIEARIEKEIAKNGPFAVLYLDLNQFKAYNDSYGFEAGDRVIRATANLLVRLTRESGGSGDFIGHIGGDDFIIVTAMDRAEELCEKIIKGFDETAPLFYNETDRARGCITSTDRQGNIKQFPFLSIAIGVVHNKFRNLTSLGQISQIGSELKKHAKASTKSCCIVDRRRD